MTYRVLAELMRAERQRPCRAVYDVHAPRYRGVMEMAGAGCDDDEIMVNSVHASKPTVHKYAAEARPILRERQAREKRLSTERNRNKKVITGLITA